MSSDAVDRFIQAQNSLVVQHSDFSLRAIYDMAKTNAIDLEPHYQRRERWGSDKQSALIESFILNVPVPPVYLSEDDFGKYSIIDGKQRLTTIRNFLDGTFRLRDLSQFPELEGCYFKDLPLQIQNALTVRPYIRVITLLRQTDPKLKFEVFLRLNTGGEKLLAQEIRNVAFSGPLNDLLFKLSETPFLWSQMKILGPHSNSYRKMDDVEHVLRFFTVEQRWRGIGQVLNHEMDEFMREYRFADQTKLESMAHEYYRSIGYVERIWERHAFHKPQRHGWREQFISPLFDAQMVAVSLFTDQQLDKAVDLRSIVVGEFINRYLGDHEFEKSVSQSTNNPANVKYRIQAVAEALGTVA